MAAIDSSSSRVNYLIRHVISLDLDLTYTDSFAKVTVVGWTKKQNHMHYNPCNGARLFDAACSQPISSSRIKMQRIPYPIDQGCLNGVSKPVVLTLGTT